jgi:hypothetical protein
VRICTDWSVQGSSVQGEKGIDMGTPYSDASR